MHATTPTALRWEWRTFGRHFGPAENRFAELTPSEPKESDETYFLSRGGQNVKVRDGLMDVKILRDVNADGLEQWAPVMKAPFPLSAAAVAQIMDALDVSERAFLREGSSLDELVEACARPDSGIRVLNVHKRRVRYSIEGCMAELSDITVNGEPIRTAAVESEDADAVMRGVAALELGGHTNTNFLRGLADLIDHVPERYAVVDVGTNSVKFHIGARSPDGRWTAVADRAELTRLGEGLADTGRICDAAIDRTATAIAGMAAEAERTGVRAIAGVGTAGLRIAANAAQVVSAFRERTGLQVEVISGEERHGSPFSRPPPRSIPSRARLLFLIQAAAVRSLRSGMVVTSTSVSASTSAPRATRNA